MTALDRILRRPATPDAVSDPHHTCHAYAADLDRAYQATVARMQHTIDTQTIWIEYQARQIARLKMIAGLPGGASVDPRPMTPAELRISRQLDEITRRLETGQDGILLRTWLRL